MTGRPGFWQMLQGRAPSRSSAPSPARFTNWNAAATPGSRRAGNLTGVIWQIIRETASQRLALQRGEVHIAVDLTSEDMDALKDRPGVVRVIEPEYRTFSIKMNTNTARWRTSNCARRSPMPPTTRPSPMPQAMPT
jgi:hypothetical protein